MENDRVTQAAIALGSVAPTIIRTPVAEKALIGRELTSETIADAAKLAASTPSPIDDVRGSADYRAEMVKVLVARALRKLAANEQAAEFPDNPAMLWGENQAKVVASLPNAVEHAVNTPIETVINGEERLINSGQEKTLLRWLREDAGLIGTKEGCAEGECGACTVFIDGVAVMSCMVAAPRVHGSEVVTVEGLKQNGMLHPIQSAFIDEGAVQCGYCTPGFFDVWREIA